MSSLVTASEEAAPAAPARRTDRNRPLLLLLGAVAAVLTLLSNRYGYYHDEMYFLVSGQHPAWGYPDQPPLTPLLARLGDAVAPGEVWAVRIPATICTVLTVLFVALMVRELGGSRRAELIAAGAFSCSTMVLITGHVLGTSTTDLAFVAALSWLLCRLIRTGDTRLWLVVGPVLGVGLLNKMTLALWVFAVLVALVCVGPRRIMFSRWFLVAGLVALAFWTPYLLWQADHDWPQLTMASALREQAAQGGSLGLLPYQVVVGPFLLPLCVAGMVWLWRSSQFRVFTVTFVVFAGLLMLTGGKATYLAGAYAAVFAGAGLAVDHWMRSRSRALTLYGVLGLSLLLAAPLGLPLLPVRTAISFGNALTVDQARSQSGWPELADSVADAMEQLTPAERSRAVVYASSYGQAAALQRFGPSRGLPQAYSGHNGFATWGPPPDSADIAIVVDGYRRTGPGDVPDWTQQACRTLGQAGVVAAPTATREKGKPIWLCHLRQPWSALWPRLTRLG
ncbi:glycosyltransferase family 39 protein [Kribbella sp. CA-293567]|uniref:glycosyltransferase family 39 protein n=1 Tax=Kribbella sp. CA-293567 TaxID=3002436 RepID=UPI0022DD92CB|nr:glycosyltransferase family 39 protein [Kribbella sp. CA-293567]WBQ08276.1 glycosyltransferase family 39 protein [Kribbella sp. CA-293567]